MRPRPGDDPILGRFRSEIERAYGPRLERAILYGSRARGDAREDSDYDIAVFLRDVVDPADKFDRLADIGSDILYEAGKLVHARPYRAGAYRDRTPLMLEIRRDGVDI
jgi:predicted nucleotidyltransferase